MIYTLHEKKFWLDELCDALITRKNSMDGGVLTCAAGMTPSCPIHFGILREVMLVYFVSEELKRRGHAVRFIYYWDDYDHFCKIPYYATEKQVSVWLGLPLVCVQDFDGVYASYGIHYMKEFEHVLSGLNIYPEYNYQSVEYKKGAYAAYLRKALDERLAISDYLYGTKSDSERNAFYPVKAYCARCGKDTTQIKSYDKAADTVSYWCECGHTGSYGLDCDFKGKLIWKVNWAMRWTADSVDFEPSGENQLLSEGSYAASSCIAEHVFGGNVPLCLPYRFVGTATITKVSRKLGRSALASTLLDVAEPALVRWLFLYNSPQKTLCIDINEGIYDLYKDWDAFTSSALSIIDAPHCPPENPTVRIYLLACEGVPVTAERLPFELLTTAICYAGGNRTIALQLLYRICKKTEDISIFERHIEPRFTAAWNHIVTYHPEKLVYVKETVDFGSVQQSTLYTPLVKRFCSKLEFPVSALKAELLLHDTIVNGVSSGNVKKITADAYRLLYTLFFGTESGPKLSVLLEILPQDKIRKLCEYINRASNLQDA